jgi:putative oxidoreductase
MFVADLIRLVDAAARMLIASLFIYSGVGKILDPAATTGRLASVGFPLPTLSAYAAIAVELGSSLALILNFRVPYACTLLAAMTLATAALFHQWWAAGAAQQAGQTIHFLKNAAILGGLWFVARADFSDRRRTEKRG